MKTKIREFVTRHKKRPYDYRQAWVDFDRAVKAGEDRIADDIYVKTMLHALSDRLREEAHK